MSNEDHKHNFGVPLENQGHEITKTILGKYTLEMFPEGYVLLNQELATNYHPKVAILLNEIPVDELDIRIAVIAHYCGVIVDGDYTLESRSELCAILSGRLFHLREFDEAQTIIGSHEKTVQ